MSFPKCEFFGLEKKKKEKINVAIVRFNLPFYDTIFSFFLLSFFLSSPLAEGYEQLTQFPPRTKPFAPFGHR